MCSCHKGGTLDGTRQLFTVASAEFAAVCLLQLQAFVAACAALQSAAVA